MARALHLAAVTSAERMIPMPKKLRVDFDNTTAEGKNAMCFTRFSWLVAEDRFQVVDAESMKVGHTHNIQDQRLSFAASILADAGRLEFPRAFIDQLKRRVFPIGVSTTFDVEMCHASYNKKDLI